MPSPIELRTLVDEHLKATATPPSTFGLKAVGDPNFVRNLRNGREPRSRVVERVVKFIEQASPPTHADAAT
jgi:hypothetical protein